MTDTEKARIADTEASISRAEGHHEVLPYLSDWSLAGPIIEREGISIEYAGLFWQASISLPGQNGYAMEIGNTPLDAAMTCYLNHRAWLRVAQRKI